MSANAGRAEDAGWVRVVAPPRLNVAAAPGLRSDVDAQLTAHAPRVLVDLSATVFLDSSGLGALIGAMKAARTAGGEVRLFGVGPQVRQVLWRTSLDRVFVPFESAEAAMSDG